VLVNDGSPDNSLDLAIKLTEQDSHVVVVDLSRNFGHHKAMMTGLAHAKGELIFLIDSDLEEEPEWLEAFLQQMRQDCCDVVYGVQERRKGNWFERWSGQWFYRFFKALTGLTLPENVGDAIGAYIVEAEDMLSLFPKDVVIVVAKFGSSPSAAASSFKVSSVAGAESTIAATAAAEAELKSILSNSALVA
jgi:glycosyltransferase involved in cell wall biosynthesis